MDVITLCSNCGNNIYKRSSLGGVCFYCLNKKDKKGKIIKPKKIPTVEDIIRRKYIMKRSYKKWKDNNPEKFKAHKLVYSAIRNKTLIKGICFCGNEKVEAHHEDYSKPLDVIWVCKKHHAELDKIKKQRDKELSTSILFTYYYR